MERRPDSEPNPIDLYEVEVQLRLADVVNNYLGPDDIGFIDDLDPEDRLGYVYGRLLESGIEEPGVIFKEFGVIEDLEGEEQ